MKLNNNTHWLAQLYERRKAYQQEFSQTQELISAKSKGQAKQNDLYACFQNLEQLQENCGYQMEVQRLFKGDLEQFGLQIQSYQQQVSKTLKNVQISLNERMAKFKAKV